MKNKQEHIKLLEWTIKPSTYAILWIVTVIFARLLSEAINEDDWLLTAVYGVVCAASATLAAATTIKALSKHGKE